MEKTLQAMMEAGWAADNVAFGSGGGLLQKLDRHMQRCQVRCSHAVGEGGKNLEILSNPLALKEEIHKGVVTVQRSKGKYFTVSGGKPEKGELKVVFQNGVLKEDIIFQDIQRRS